MAKISLCMIVGNVEEYIERCLDSFKPIADEICVVRAVGSLTPDRTLDICRDKYGAKIGEYRNAPGHEDWPHVDSFAAARQMSFDLATGDFCFWCDSDDVLKSGAARIRQHANEQAYACFIFPYEIFGKNVTVPRERMMLRDSGEWRQPVHEFYKFKVERVTAASDDGVVIQHLPKITKEGSNERNLRILESIPEAEQTVGLKYHLFGELMGANRTDEAIALAVKLLTESELARDERYDLLLSLVIHTQNMDERVQLLHEAYKTDPERREALGVLSCTMMDLNRPASALAYARQMMATPQPDLPAWNSRTPFYGYTGDDICQQALRVCGRADEAEVLRRRSLQRHGRPVISLIHATRGRPQQASKCRKVWHDLAANPGRLEHIFCIDADDAASAPLKRFHHAVVPAGGGCVRAWNWGGPVTDGEVIIQLSDDWIPVPQWDEIILQRLGDLNKPSVLAISDGVRSDRLLCMAILTRQYYNQDYFIFHPWFKGVFSDNLFTDIAYSRKQVIEARDIVFRHNHPVCGNVPMDETYRIQNSPERYATGEATYRELLERRDWSTVPGYFNYWQNYEEIARELKSGDTVVEVGVWLGRSIIYLAQELKRLGKKCRLVAVDHFKGELGVDEHADVVASNGGSNLPVFKSHLERCGVADVVEIIEGDSAESAARFADGSVAFCFIDAAHDYDNVKRDIAAWRPKIKRGGILSGHDIMWPPVKRAVEEMLPGWKSAGYCWEVSA